MHRSIAPPLGGPESRPPPAALRWAAVPAFVALAWGLGLPLDASHPAMRPMLPFVLAVLGAAGVGGLGPGLLATAAGLAVPGLAIAVGELDDGVALRLGYKAAVFALAGVAISCTIETLHRQRARLVAAARRMRLVAENSPVMLAHVDLRGRYLFVSKAYGERFGVDPAAVVGRRVEEVVGAHAWATIGPRLARALSGESVEYEAELCHHGIGARYVHVAYVPDRDAAGRVRGIFAAITDLSERRRLEDRLRALDRRKDEYLAVLSHELRNPLAPIRTAARALGRLDARALDPRSSTLVAATVPVIERQVAHMTRLVDDLLDATRMSRGAIELAPAPTSVRAVVQVALDTVRDVVEARGHALEVVLPEAEVALRADPSRLAQIVANLLHNAAKFTPAGGRLSLRVARAPVGGTLAIEVRDDGIGIAPGRLGAIFEMFEQGQRPEDLAEGGLGIGLALVRELVRLHGGTVEAESGGPGRGSRFVVRLPVVAPRAPEAAPAAHAHRGHRRETDAQPLA